jgi:hypothetical protein
MFPILISAAVIPTSLIPTLRKQRGLKGVNLREHFISLGVSLLIFMVVTLHAFLVVSGVSPFKCIPSGSNYYLFDNTAIACFDSTWYSWLGAVIVFALLYAIGLPGTLIYLFYRNRDKINTEEFKMRYGSITHQYRDEMFWWELVQVSKRTCFATINIFLKLINVQDLAVFITMLLLASFQVLQSAYMPYKEHSYYFLSTT